MATVVDDVVSAQLNTAAASVVQFGAAGHLHALERLRSSFDQDGRAIGASIASVMVQASIPDQAMNDKLAYDTPRSSQDTITK